MDIHIDTLCNRHFTGVLCRCFMSACLFEKYEYKSQSCPGSVRTREWRCPCPSRRPRLTFAQQTFVAESILEYDILQRTCIYIRKIGSLDGRDSNVCRFCSESGKYQRRGETLVASVLASSFIHRTFIDDENPSLAHKSRYYKPKRS
jgi:hypothetical protein